MNIARTKHEAMQLFLKSSTDSVLCKDNYDEKLVYSYPEAETFFSRSVSSNEDSYASKRRDDDSDFTMPSFTSDYTPSSYSSSDNDSFSGFGGGESGGSGSSGSWDSGSSYDSGSSSDSGGSFGD